MRLLGSAYGEAIKAAARALALAAELALPEPARALGYRGAARCCLGDRDGLSDMRRALQLAIEQGQGHAAAALHNNLAASMWDYEGPQAALERCRDGIDFSERRGVTSAALRIAAMSTTFVAEVGQTEQALAEAEPLAERLLADGNIAFTEPRALQLRLLAERGAHERAPAAGDIVARARESGEPQLYAVAFAAAARLLLAQGSASQAQALLVELEQVPGIRAEPYYAPALPELVRTALALGDRELAARLVAGIEPRTPLAAHALAACRAQLAEAAGDPSQAVASYAEAAERWREFGNVPERAYALLGQARCTLTLGHAGAEVPLADARALFASMGYKAALDESEALLQRTAAA